MKGQSFPHITPLEIAVWEHYLEEQTAPLKDMIRKKKSRRIAILSGDDTGSKAEYICRILNDEITAMENAIIAIEAVRIAYSDHCLQINGEYQSRIKFLEMKWRGCWQLVCQLRNTILSQQNLPAYESKH
ncbi:MAG: hypothetical protein KDD15_15835 [Lewinella sp.]|nr:hypothetical protein [Lewinella sp.]